MKNCIESNAIKKLKDKVVCPVEVTLRILGGKWRGSILYQLRNGELRFNELKKQVQNGVIDYEDTDNFLSNKVLSSHLNDLIEYQIIQKNKNATNKNLTYELTATGIALVPTLIELFYWGEHLMRLPTGNHNYKTDD